MSATRSDDFTIRVATVNGSGSQSANLVLTNAIFRMGVPVAPKNVFPSNIEGLPTWFDVRVTKRGYRCRSRNVDVLVSLNLMTWQADVARVRSGGIVVYDASFSVHGVTAREDLSYYPVPFAELAKARFPNGSTRKYLTNMIYVGVVAELLEIDPAALDRALAGQFAKKHSALTANRDAIAVGVAYARTNLTKNDPYRVVANPGGNAGSLFMDGNRAAALGCLMGGCTVAAWYPITPSSSLCESFIALADTYRVDRERGEKRAAIVQAEDELAAIGIVLGAGWAGARAMTSTSGPGLSLMAELVGLGYFAEIPGVIFDVQRAGPSTGLPTRTMQGDVAFAATLSHGDTKHIVLLPGTVVEAYEDAMAAFDLAEMFQTPVFVLSDLDLGMNAWLTEPLVYPERPFERGKVLDAAALESVGDWARYRDTDGDGIPWRTLPGNTNARAGYFTRGTGHDERAYYSEDPAVWTASLDRLSRKYATARAAVPPPSVDDAGRSVAILAYGTTHHAVIEARDLLHEEGVEVDYLRVRALPFAPEVAEFIARHERVYVVEQNRDGQLYGLLRIDLPADLVGRLHSIRHYDGVPIDAHAIVEPLLAAERLPAAV